MRVFSPLQAQDESAAADAAAKPVNDPPHVILPGSTHMPLIGLGTYKLQSPGSVKAALESECLPLLSSFCCWVLCRSCVLCRLLVGKAGCTAERVQGDRQAGCA